MTSTLARLRTIPWCASLLSSPHWIHCPVASRTPKPSGEDSYFAETLGTSRTIQSVTLLHPAEKSIQGFEGIYYDEIRAVFELGDGLNGYPGIAHGGFVCTLLDESMGMFLQLNVETGVRGGLERGMMNMMTAYLNTSYKKPVPTAGTIMSTVKVVKRERNKTYLRATIEDGQGTVLTVGEGMFVTVKNKL